MSFKMMDGVEVYTKAEVDVIKDNINETSAQNTSDVQQLNQNKADKTYAQETRQIANDAKNAIGDDNQHGLKGRVKTVEDAIGDNNIAGSIKGRIDHLETHSVTTEEMNQQLVNKADKNYAQQTRQIANNNSSAISALENRATVLENNKANVSDLSNTNDRVTALENNKADKSEIPSMVSSAIDNSINGKIASIESDINHIVDNAIDDALEDYDTPAQTTQKTATAISTALQSYDNSNTVDNKINAAVATRPAAMSTSEATAIVNQYF